MPVIHSKLGFHVEELKPKRGRKPIKGSSIPFILPNDLKYNTSTGSVEKKPGTKRKNLQIVPEALDLLEGIEGSLSVISICGPCRSGKSYILSRLLGTSDAFELGHRMDPQTFGIWMGTKALRGKDFTIVLLDTEGIDAVGASAGQDASILVMTILLSSQLIYNSLSVPHKGDLEKMQCFLKLAKGITVKQGDVPDQSELSEYFPHFLWLLRDVCLKMRDKDGKDMDPTEYLKTKVLGSQGENEPTSDNVGQAILTFFSSVECATLESPTENPDVMNSIAKNTDSLNPRFNKGVDELIERLLLKASAKRGYYKGSTVNGFALSSMAKQYVEAVNDPNSIPALDNTWKNTVELMQNKAIEEVVEDYNRQMQAQVVKATRNGQVPLKEGTRRHGNNPTRRPSLMDLHNRQFEIAKDTLLKKVGHLGASSGDLDNENATVVDQLQRRLVGYVAEDIETYQQKWPGGELLHYIQQNRELSTIFCKQLLERLLYPIRKRVENPPPGYDFQNLLGELANTRQQYNEQARGPMKRTVLKKMTEKFEQLKADLMRTEEYKRKLLEEQQRTQEAKLRAKERERELQQLRKQTEDMPRAQQEIVKKMEQHHREMIEKVEQGATEQRALDEQRYRELQDALLEEKMKMRLDELLSAIRDLVLLHELASRQQELENTRRELESLLEDLPSPPRRRPNADSDDCTIL